jgi:GT2 family glycosyltransferase
VSASTLAVVIPTFERHQTLVETVEQVLQAQPAADEVIVVDQSPAHPPEVQQRLDGLATGGRIRWLRMTEPSIPRAMNLGLRAATADLVLFLDDDVVPVRDLVARHAEAHREPGVVVVAGQVLQPGEEPEPLAGARFAFRSSLRQQVEEVMGGNFSVRRTAALECGGFDENFVQVAYRFEADFCRRICRHGSIAFEPAAGIRHLRAGSGGTRSYGDHLRTARPAHAVGEYYYLLCDRSRPGRWRAFLGRPWRAIATRHHLTHPWWILPTLCAELIGMSWALALRARGPRLVSP